MKQLDERVVAQLDASVEIQDDDGEGRVTDERLQPLLDPRAG